MMRTAHLARSIEPEGAAATAERIRSGEQPHPSIEAHLLSQVVRAYPRGGNCLEAAVRMAIQLGWAGRHDLQLRRDEATD